VECFKKLQGVEDSDFIKWHDEQVEYLTNLKKEPRKDVLYIEYVEALEKLEKAE
jgi:hypothetical protein